MIRAPFRLMAGSLLTAVFFSLASFAPGYMSIDDLKWHAPFPIPAELAVLETGLVTTAPAIFGLSQLPVAMMTVCYRATRILGKRGRAERGASGPAP
jgi:hypothetical protein